VKPSQTAKLLDLDPHLISWNNRTAEAGVPDLGENRR
jgi:hypothetical protein